MINEKKFFMSLFLYFVILEKKKKKRFPIFCGSFVVSATQELPIFFLFSGERNRPIFHKDELLRVPNTKSLL